MIMPTKHIATPHSLLGGGAMLLERLKTPRTVTSLWQEVHEAREIGTFEHFSLALDLLYSLGAVEFEDGLLRRVSR